VRYGILQAVWATDRAVYTLLMCRGWKESRETTILKPLREIETERERERERDRNRGKSNLF